MDSNTSFMSYFHQDIDTSLENQLYSNIELIKEDLNKIKTYIAELHDAKASDFSKKNFNSHFFRSDKIFAKLNQINIKDYHDSNEAQAFYELTARCQFYCKRISIWETSTF